MGEERGEGSRSVTGVWQGIYSYPVSGLPTAQFTATLIEAGAMLSGSVHEADVMSGSAGETLYFFVNGDRHGRAVNFIKTFQGDSLRFGKIIYDGTLNEDATEIEGRWNIPGDWSGRFLMTRAGDPARAVAASEGATHGVEAMEPMPAR